MDHHTADQDSNGNLIIPDADILLDPEALPDGNDFCDYCGSGITNKLINYMIQRPVPLRLENQDRKTTCEPLLSIPTLGVVSFHQQ